MTHISITDLESDIGAIRKYCILGNEKIINGASCKKEWKGKTPKQLGFSFIEKINEQQ